MRPFMAGIAGAVAMMKPAVVKKIDRAQNERNRPTFDLPAADGTAVAVELFVSRDRLGSASAGLGSAYLRLRCRVAERAMSTTTVKRLPSTVCYRLERSRAGQPGLAEVALREHSEREALGLPEIGHRAALTGRDFWCCGWDPWKGIKLVNGHRLWDRGSARQVKSPGCTEVRSTTIFFLCSYRTMPVEWVLIVDCALGAFLLTTSIFCYSTPCILRGDCRNAAVRQDVRLQSPSDSRANDVEIAIY